MSSFTRNEFANIVRQKYPDTYASYDDNELVDKVLTDYPEYQPYVESPKPDFNPDFSDHLNKTWFNMKSMGVEIPQAAIGVASSFMMPDDQKVVMGWSEGLRDWSKQKQDEWIEEDPGIQAYLQWQQDTPMSIDNIWNFDMMMRGVTDLAPSVAAMMGTGFGAGAFLKAAGMSARAIGMGSQAMGITAMGAMEGSGAYAEAMQYLVDEKGIEPYKAVDTAANTAIATAVGNGLLEYYGINKLLKVAGVKEGAEKLLIPRLANKFIDNAIVTGTAKVSSVAVTEALTEATQSINQELLANVYKKYDGDPEKAFSSFLNDFIESAGSPETKESALSALAGTILTGGVGVLGGGILNAARSKRLLNNYKEKELNRQIIEDTVVEKEDKTPARDRDVVSISELVYGNKGVAQNEKKVIENIYDNDGGTPKRINYHVNKIINEGVDALHGVDPEQFVKKVEAFRDETLTDDILNQLKDVVKQEVLTDKDIEADDVILSDIEGQGIESAEVNQSASIDEIINNENVEVVNEEIIEIKDQEDLNDVIEQNPDLIDDTAEPVQAKEGTQQQAKFIKDKPEIKVGDTVQWTTEGVDQFKVPRKITGLYDGYVTVEGSKTGIPINQISKIKIKDKSGQQKQLSPDEIKYNEIQARIKDIDKELKENKEIQDHLKKEYPGFKPDAKRNREIKNLKEEKSILQEQASAMEAVLDERKAERKVEDTVEKPKKKKVITEKLSDWEKGDSWGMRARAQAVKALAKTGLLNLRKDLEEPKVDYRYARSNIIADRLEERGIIKPYRDKDNKYVGGKFVITDKFKGKTAEEIFQATFKDNEIVYKYQQAKKGELLSDNKELSERLQKRLGKKFRYVKAKGLQQVFDEDGREVAGRAFGNAVEWSKGKATIDTIPHEYGHIYIKIMKDSRSVKEGIKRFGSEEKLVQYMGEYYANKMKDKSLKSKFKTWLRKFKNELKRFFKVAMTDKEVADLISERFYSYEMKESDLKRLKNVSKPEYQQVDIDEKSILQENSEQADAIRDNDVAIDDTEVDARESIQRAIDRSLNLLGVPISIKERNSLLKAITTNDYNTWYSNHALPLIQSKNNKLNVKPDNINLNNLYSFIVSQVSTNRDDENNAITDVSLVKHQGKYTLKKIKSESMTYSTKSTSGFKKSKKQNTVGFISHNNEDISKALEDILFINDSDFFVQSNFDSNNNPVAKKSYSFLNLADLTALTRKTIKHKGKNVKVVPLFSRGDSGKIALGVINDRHIKLASNDKSYNNAFKSFYDLGYLGKGKEAEKLLQQYQTITKKELRENALATFDYLNKFIPGWITYDFAEVLKRIKVPLTPTFRRAETPDAKARFINTKDSKGDLISNSINFRFNGKKVNGIRNIKDLGSTHIGDGNTLTSRSYVRKIAKIYGLDPEIGKIKSVMYHVGNQIQNNKRLPLQDVDMIMLKHQHSVPEAGLEIYEGNEFVAKVDQNGDMIDKNGQVIDMIMTNDEAKMASGQFNNKEFVIPGSAFGLVKMSTKKRTNVKFPLQWMNHVVDTDFINKLVDQYAGPKSKSYGLIRTFINATKNPETLKKFTNVLVKDYGEEMSPALNKNVQIGGGLHPQNIGPLEIIAKGKILSPAFNLAGQPGAILDFAPNYAGDLDVNEIAVDKDFILNKIKGAGFNKSTPIKTINDYLKTKDIRVLGYRSPVAYSGGSNYLRIKRVHDVKGTVQLHHSMTFRNMEGDYDGDSFILVNVPTELDQDFKDYFSSREYQKNIQGLDLKKYIKKKKINKAHPLDRNQIIEAMVYSNTAIGEIASTQTVYGLMKNSINSFIVDGVSYSINDKVNFFGEEMSVDRLLRIYLQAAVDNPKFLLLKEWKYNINNLRSVLYKETATGVPLSLRFKQSKQKRIFSFSPYKAINSEIYKKYKGAVQIRDITDGDARLDVEALLNASGFYNDFIADRKKYFDDKANILGNFKDNVGLLEEVVTLPNKIFYKYQSNINSDSRVTPTKFTVHEYKAAHNQALDKLKYDDRLQELKDKMGNKFNSAYTYAQAVVKATESALMTDKLNTRPIQPMSWEANEKLVDIRVKALPGQKIAGLESVKNASKEGLEVFTLSVLKHTTKLDQLIPSEYLHQPTIKKYYNAFTEQLTGKPTDKEMKDLALDQTKERLC